MSLSIPAMTSARMGIQASIRLLDRAAGAIARAGLEIEPSPPATAAAPAANPAPAATDADLADAMARMLIAQRAFSANMRVLETAASMDLTATRIGRGNR